jgi:hypothetical protein
VTDQETRDRRAKAEEESSRRRVRRVGEPSESRHGVATAAEGGCAKRTRHWTWTLDSAVVALALRTGLPENIILGLFKTGSTSSFVSQCSSNGPFPLSVCVIFDPARGLLHFRIGPATRRREGKLRERMLVFLCV